MLTKEEVLHIAALARIHLSDDELLKYQHQLSSILDYIGMLKEVDTSAVEKTSQVTGLLNVTRVDEVHNASVDEHERIVSQFPKKVGNLLKVKAVFE